MTEEKLKVDTQKTEITMWSEKKITDFRSHFLSWYDLEKRTLPWRENNDPYRIWVSEIMLQQTRVDTVIPYYLNFMKLFPTIADLAVAEEDTLLKAWEGLGYYSRVRNLQKAAIQIMNEFSGEMPAKPEDIATLKGIGPYTTGAISSMAFQLPVPAVDGNVMRVVSRLFEISEDIAKPASRKTFEAIMNQIIDPYKPGDFNQAMMDLGSSTCTPTTPTCNLCPINEFCQAFEAGTMTQYPVKSKKKKAKPVYYAGLLIQNERGEFLIEKRPAEGLLANMWTFPLLPEELLTVGTGLKIGKLNDKLPETIETQVLNNLSVESRQRYQIEPIWLKKPFGEVVHLFSHLKWFITSYYGKMSSEMLTEAPENCLWVHPSDFENYTFPGPQQKMWKSYLTKFEK
ncbi:A/G-specific adenine glycosylase [Carnobacterium maltaromaticum]|uniref:A/G-specific adenine glycosylase n=1 Tax=Carnobacterium maltaromaticum TaxID=2751 RepID=UPI00298A7A04|nr:A/G-specific adenine glycosylase [Carnobacterium maltaromaticum]MDW5525438.1 A/G-specific adenine glycosylase [Carnobacterium maltaromaticum]